MNVVNFIPAYRMFLFNWRAL